MEGFLGTQGEWEVTEYRHPRNKMNGFNFAVKANNGCKSPVCAFPCSTSDIQSDILLEKQMADALLIAAAPELLEALIEIVDRFAGFEDFDGNQVKQLVKAELAISKALGQ